MSQRPQIGTGLWTTGLRWRPNARDAHTTDRTQGVGFRPIKRRDNWRIHTGGGFSSAIRWCRELPKSARCLDRIDGADAEMGFRALQRARVRPSPDKEDA